MTKWSKIATVNRTTTLIATKPNQTMPAILIALSNYDGRHEEEGRVGSEAIVEQQRGDGSSARLSHCSIIIISNVIFNIIISNVIICNIIIIIFNNDQ